MAATTIAQSNLRLSCHAKRRMEELQIPRELIDQTLANPDVRWPGRNGCTELVGSRIIVTVAPHNDTVVTVKIRTAKPYRHGVHTLHNLPR